MLVRLLFCLSVVVSLTACASGPRPTCPALHACPATSEPQIPTLSLQALMAMRGQTQFRISRAGDRIAWIESDGASRVLCTRSVEGNQVQRLAEYNSGHMFLRGFAPDGRSLLYMVDKLGNESWRLRQVFIDGGRDRKLLKMRFHVDRLLSISGQTLLLSLRRRIRPGLWSRVVASVDLRTGKKKIIESMPERRVIRWFADGQLRVRAALVLGKKGRRALLVRDGPKDEWRMLRSWSKGSEVRIRGFGKDGRSLLVFENSDADKFKLGRLNLASGEFKEIFHDPGAEVVQTIFQDGELAAVATEHARRRWHVLNDEIANDFRILTESFGDDFSIYGYSSGHRRCLVYVDKDQAPPSTFLYDMQRGKLDLLGVQIDGLQNQVLAPMEAVSIPARDGLQLVAYLTRPPGAKGRPVPLVLFVHGGPEARDHWGFDPWVQFLASRGYAVLQVNYRGSSGLGKAYALAGKDNRLGGKTPQDLADALAWAKANLPLQADRVAVFGFSYGGYATLASLVQNPDLYACGVDGFGIGDLLRQRRFPVSFAQASLKKERKSIYDPRRIKARDASPIREVEEIRAPLLIVHGANDPRVSGQQSKDFVEALRSVGGCVEFVFYPDEGHGFQRPANQIDFARRLEAFLARHLCGCAEAPARVPGTSAQVH